MYETSGKMAACIKFGVKQCCQRTPNFVVSYHDPLSIPLQLMLVRLKHQARNPEDHERYLYNEEFVPYEIKGLEKGSTTNLAGSKTARSTVRQLTRPLRSSRMPFDQDWTKVWPTAQSFRHSLVPFAVRQGLVKNTQDGDDGLPPVKYGNTELTKIPNFLHLTPPHIKKHARAIKKYCTPFPAEVDSAYQDEHFPLRVTTSDYCFSSPSIRDPRARVVTITFKLSSLKLDKHARDKFLRLVGRARYNKETDIVTIITDRCPVKSQNKEHAMYLLTALFFESWKVKPWESLKTEADMEEYLWDRNISKTNIVDLLQKVKKIDQGEPVGLQSESRSYLETSDSSDESSDSSSEESSGSSSDEESSVEELKLQAEEICSEPEVKVYKTAVEKLFNEGESRENIDSYKDSVKKLLLNGSSAEASR